MAFPRRWLLILFALILGGGQLFAAGSTKEQRAYASAVAAFQDEMYPRAENELEQFVKKFPDSTNAPMAVLLQAQAEIQQRKFSDAAKLLQDRRTQAGSFADQYDYWLAQVQVQDGDLKSAAENFAAVARNFPKSKLGLPATEDSASAYMKLGDWTNIVMLLQETNGAFRRMEQTDPADEHVSNLRLLLAQAESALNEISGSDSVLASLNPQLLTPKQDWQRVYLLYQNRQATGDWGAALAATTNLLQIARLGRDDALRAESAALRAGLLEKLKLPDDAIAAYSENLTNTAPPERQRQAILKIAELSIAQNQFTNAEQSLADFLQNFSAAPAADITLLTLGELYLKDYAAQPSATNRLAQAQSQFDQLLAKSPNGPLAGNAFLDRGWCNWLAGKILESLADFKAAAQKLPPSESLAVARFKMGDAFFKQGNFQDALKNYGAVLEDFANLPDVRPLAVRALYQILRVNLELNDLKGASNALAQILKNYPADELAQSGTLLLGETSADPQHARDLFQTFEKQFPASPLRAQVALAVARTYEMEPDWSAAITNYQNWSENFPTNDLRPQADYALARANFQAGNETNAFVLFTNFVARFPTNGLAPLAQWWIADHFYRAGEFVGAETNYEFVFQNPNWQGSPLFYPAQMMAGRAAMGRTGYKDAIRYFSALASDTNCPPDLNAQALFAWGSALMHADSTDTNNPLANFAAATNVFGQICQMYPTNELGMRARGEIGNCDLQLANYDDATNAYAQVFSSPFANISARSQAQIGFGIALEKKAALTTGDDQRAWLELALNNYVDVLHEENLRDGEAVDLFWVKKAGLQAAAAAETLDEWEQAADIYARLQKLLPQLSGSLDRKIAEADTHLPQKKN